MDFKTEICIRKMTKTVRYSYCHALESNQTEIAGRIFQFNHRDLDGPFEGEVKQTTKKFFMTKTILGHKSNRFFGRRRCVRAADPPYHES